MLQRIVRRPASRGWFTLIEMLVVISIIGILAALLMPGLMSAMNSAQTTSCMNNQKQVAYGFGMYSGDYHGKILRRWRTSASLTVYWSPFLSGKQLHTSAGFPSAIANGPSYVPAGPTFICPATPKAGSFAKLGGNGGWESEYSGYGMYMPSNETYTEKTAIQESLPGSGGTYPYADLFRLSAAVRASKLILLADTVTAANASRPSAPSTVFVPTYDTSYQPRIHLLHGTESANVLFFDFHVQALDMFSINKTVSTPRYYWFKNNALGFNF